MRITESKLRSLVRGVLVEMHDEMYGDDFGGGDLEGVGEFGDGDVDVVRRLCRSGACGGDHEVAHDSGGNVCVIIDGPYESDEPGFMGSPRGELRRVYLCLTDFEPRLGEEIYEDDLVVTRKTVSDFIGGF